MASLLIRPYPRTNDPRDIEKWYNELRRNIQSIAGDTDSLPEGTTNLYFTTARARAALSAGAPITYNPTTGVVDIALGNGLTETLGSLVVNAGSGLEFSSGALAVKQGDGLKFTSGTLEADLASNKGLEISSGAIAVKDGDGIKTGTAGVEVDYNSTNLKITTGALNTIQDIATSSSPTFAQVTAGSSGNTATINSEGLTLAGTATRWNDLVIPLFADPSGTGQPDWITIGPSGTIKGWGFHGTTAGIDSLRGSVEFLHDYKEGSNVTLHIHWMPSTTNVGDVTWHIEYRWFDDGDTLGGTTSTDVTTASSGTAWKCVRLDLATITGTGHKIGSQFHIVISRDPNGSFGSDTFTGDAHIVSMGIHYEVDTPGGSAQITSKT